MTLPRLPAIFTSVISGSLSVYTREKVLELGCGEGGNLLPFAEAGCEVTGIDIVKTRIEQAVEFFARKKAKGTFICSDIADVSEDIGKFELIVIHDVIEHIPGGGGETRRYN